MVLALIFRFLIHLGLAFVCDVKHWFRVFFASVSSVFVVKTVSLCSHPDVCGKLTPLTMVLLADPPPFQAVEAAAVKRGTREQLRRQGSEETCKEEGLPSSFHW